MACSAIYFLDMKGKVLLHRNYRGDIDGTVIDKFIGKIDNITETAQSVFLQVWSLTWKTTSVLTKDHLSRRRSAPSPTSSTATCTWSPRPERTATLPCCSPSCTRSARSCRSTLKRWYLTFRRSASLYSRILSGRRGEYQRQLCDLLWAAGRTDRLRLSSNHRCQDSSGVHYSGDWHQRKLRVICEMFRKDTSWRQLQSPHLQLQMQSHGGLMASSIAKMR